MRCGVTGLEIAYLSWSWQPPYWVDDLAVREEDEVAAVFEADVASQR